MHELAGWTNVIFPYSIMTQGGFGVMLQAWHRKKDGLPK